jgi:hypothetical protein
MSERLTTPQYLTEEVVSRFGSAVLESASQQTLKEKRIPGDLGNID